VRRGLVLDVEVLYFRSLYSLYTHLPILRLCSASSLASGQPFVSFDMAPTSSDAITSMASSYDLELLTPKLVVFFYPDFLTVCNVLWVAVDITM
jgi:hypothetical protein